MMAKDKEETTEEKPTSQMLTARPDTAFMEYIVAVLFEVDISRIGHHGALRRRHEMLGDMQEDYDQEFGEEIDD